MLDTDYTRSQMKPYEVMRMIPTYNYCNDINYCIINNLLLIMLATARNIFVLDLNSE